MAKKLKKVQVAKPGKFRDHFGREFELSPADVAGMVRNWNEHDDKLEPVVAVVSHDQIATPTSALKDEHKHGKITRAYVDADGCAAVDIDDVPDETADAVAADQLKSVSLEFYAKTPVEGVTGPAMRRVALLGKTPPAIKGLNPSGLSKAIVACSEGDSATVHVLIPLPDGVFACGEVDIIDRANLSKRLVDAGFSQTTVDGFTSEQLQEIATNLGEKKAPEAKKEPEPAPSPAPSLPVASPITAESIEAMIAKAVTEAIGKNTEAIEKDKSLAAAHKQEAKAARIDGFIAEHVRAGRISPAERDGSPKIPALRERLMACSEEEVFACGDGTVMLTQLDVEMAALAGRPAISAAPRLANNPKGDSPPGEIDAFVEEYAAEIAVVTQNKVTPKDYAVRLKRLDEPRRTAMMESIVKARNAS